MAIAKTLLKPSTSFWVDIQVERRQQNWREDFRRHGGTAMLGELLQKADLGRGRWTFRLLSGYHTTGRTPRVQIRGVDEKVLGVRIWLKPGNNETGIKGVLYVTRDRNLSPTQVYEMLKKAAAPMYEDIEDALLDPERPQPPTVDHIETVVEDGETELILMAVQSLCQQEFRYGSDIADYLNRVRTEIGAGYDKTNTELLDAIEALTNDELLLDRKSHYEVSAKGTLFLNPPAIEEEDDEEDEVVITDLVETFSAPSSSSVKPTEVHRLPAPETMKIATAPPAVKPIPAVTVPPPAPIVPAAAPAPAAAVVPKDAAALPDIGQLLSQSKNRLLALAGLSDQITASRNKQKDFRDKIAVMQKQLDDEVARERQMTVSVDIDALTRLLLGSGK